MVRNVTITRSQMVEWMKSDGCAHVTERPSHHWKRLNTIVANQSEGEINATLVGFHLFELSHNGKMHSRYNASTESGDLENALILPSSLQYHPADTTANIEMDGNYLVQQIYIDHSIFEEVAFSMFPGDPANLTRLVFNGVFDSQMKQAALTILEEARRPSAGGEFYADLMAQNVAALILRRQNGGRTRKKTFKKALSNEELARVLEYVETDIVETGGVNDLSRLLDMDTFSFLRAFKARTGEAPHQYLISRRVARVREKLQHTNEALADVAYACGFANQAHMTTVFKKHIGTTPGAYRNEVRKRITTR